MSSRTFHFDGYLTSECCARCGHWAGSEHVFCKGCVIEGAEFKYLLEVS